MNSTRPLFHLTDRKTEDAKQTIESVLKDDPEAVFMVSYKGGAYKISWSSNMNRTQAIGAIYLILDELVHYE